MNYFEEELRKIYGSKNYTKIRRVHVGIAGCGGLGSNCAFFLVRSGVGRITLVDHDEIEYSNLNRQAFFYEQKGAKKAEALRQNIQKINPSVSIDVRIQKVEKHNIKSIFSDCDIIVEAFDDPAYKKMVISELIDSKELIVSASGICGIGASDDIEIRYIKNNLALVGDFATGTETEQPYAPRVSIAAAKQADIVLEHVISR